MSSIEEEAIMGATTRVEDLARYGEAIDDLPKRVLARQAKVLVSELRRRYGTRGLVRMMVSILRERRHIKKTHPDTVAELRRDWGAGAASEGLAMTALFNVLAPIEGREGAYDVVKTVFQRVAPLSMK